MGSLSLSHLLKRNNKVTPPPEDLARAEKVAGAHVDSCPDYWSRYHNCRWRERVLAIAAEFEKVRAEAEEKGGEWEDDPSCMEAEHGGHPTCPHQEEWLRNATKRAEAAESSLAEMAKALEEDAAGQPVPDLLCTAANLLYSYGGGPVADRLRIAANTFDALLANRKEAKP